MNSVIKIMIVLSFLPLLIGCADLHVQVYNTEGIGMAHSDNIYTYENDTLGINYSFWSDGGNMRFRIYNKSTKPIYIDWKKSNLISNSYKFDYWSDKTQVTTLSSSASKSFSFKDSTQFPKIVGYSSVSSQVGISNSTISKQERITFIPPKSYIIRYVNYRLMTDYYHFAEGDKSYTQTTEQLNPNYKDKTTITTKVFTKELSPLDFRNFLTFSFKEDFSSEFYVDNEFYIKEIEIMNPLHFSYYLIDKKSGDATEMLPYKKGKDFYKTVNR